MKKNGLSDQKLILFYANGSEKAFATLLNRHKQSVFTYIYSLTCDKDVANDIFQETFIKAIREIKSGRYEEQNRFLFWVLRIARNQVLDKKREEYRRDCCLKRQEVDKFKLVSQIISKEISAEEKLIIGSNALIIKALIRSLDEDQREVLIMRHYSGMSFLEIAEVTNVSISTALGRMRHALAKLRKLIQKYNLDLA